MINSIKDDPKVTATTFQLKIPKLLDSFFLGLFIHLAEHHVFVFILLNRVSTKSGDLYTLCNSYIALQIFLNVLLIGSIVDH